MAMQTLKLESGHSDLNTARHRLLAEMEAARKQGVRVLKIIHGWGSSGAGGTLAVGIRKSLRQRIKEGKVLALIAGERFSSDSNEGRERVQRHPQLRRDRDFNRANLGITIVELVP
jgi:hypothetical protein